MAVTCPFCGFRSDGEYEIKLHIEEEHTENSLFTVASSESYKDGERVSSNVSSKCTRKDHRKHASMPAMDRLEIHDASSASSHHRKTPTSTCSSKHSPKHNPKHNSKSSSTSNSEGDPKRNSQASRTSNGTETAKLEPSNDSNTRGIPGHQQSVKQPSRRGRLGKRDLGPYAFEAEMPPEVRLALEKDAAPRLMQTISATGRLEEKLVIRNETARLIPVMAKLCSLDARTKCAYLCTPDVRHINKLRCGGNFCGYWNIQMLLTGLRTAPVPNVLEIQKLIEDGWDAGVCSYGRVETGGIEGTRKWIGTHEALACCTQLGLPADVLTFRDKPDGGRAALCAMLDYVEAYFHGGLKTAKTRGTSHATSLAPMYFQRFGHSMTIVGLERRKDESRNLLVFDPSPATAQKMKALVLKRYLQHPPEKLLRAYRWSEKELGRWKQFELLVIRTVAPAADPSVVERGKVRHRGSHQ